MYTAGLLAFTGVSYPGYAAEALSLTVGISGRIDQHCSISQMPGKVADLKQGVSRQINFNIDCNTPFKYNLASKHGGLKLQGNPRAKAVDGFRDFSEYSVIVKIPLEQGDKREIIDYCSSKELLLNSGECHFSNSGSSIAIDKQATLSLTPNTHPLIAGTYVDALILEISIN